MNTHIVLYGLLTFFSLNFAKDAPPTPPVIINFNLPIELFNLGHFTSQDTNRLSAAQMDASSQDIMAINRFDYAQSTKYAAECLKQWIGNSTYKFVAISLISAYAMLCYGAYKAKSYTHDTQRWSRWKGDYPMAQLLAIPQKELTQELMVEIERRYTDTHDAYPSFQSLAKFMQAVEEEQKNLLFYQKLYAYIAYVRCENLIFLPTEFNHQIQEQLDRLAYFNNIFNNILKFSIESLSSGFSRVSSCTSRDIFCTSFVGG